MQVWGNSWCEIKSSVFEWESCNTYINSISTFKMQETFNSILISRDGKTPSGKSLVISWLTIRVPAYTSQLRNYNQISQYSRTVGSSLSFPTVLRSSSIHKRKRGKRKKNFPKTFFCWGTNYCNTLDQLHRSSSIDYCKNFDIIGLVISSSIF